MMILRLPSAALVIHVNTRSANPHTQIRPTLVFTSESPQYVALASGGPPQLEPPSRIHLHATLVLANVLRRLTKGAIVKPGYELCRLRSGVAANRMTTNDQSYCRFCFGIAAFFRSLSA